MLPSNPVCKPVNKTGAAAHWSPIKTVNIAVNASCQGLTIKDLSTFKPHQLQMAIILYERIKLKIHYMPATAAHMSPWPWLCAAAYYVQALSK